MDVYALDDAETVLRRVLRDNPKSARAHAYLARLAYRRGQRTDGTCAAEAVAAAERELALADALQPDLSDSQLARGYLAYFANDYPRATALGLAAERDGSNALRASLFLAQVASSAGRFDEAERRASAIVDRVRDGFLIDRAYDVLGEVYAAQREFHKLGALRKLVAGRRGHDSRGRPR
jgi:lipopolysaccharide biosynthesis regulator YciM